MLLAILTVGAVSASDSINSDDSQLLSSSESDVISEDDFDDDFYDDDWGEDDDDDDDDWEDDDSDDEEEEEEDLYVFSDVDADLIYYGDANTVIAYLKDVPSDETGSLSIYECEGGKLLAVKTVQNGKASIKLADLNFTSEDVGYYELFAELNGANIYDNKTIYISFVDYKLIVPEKAYLGENAIFKATLPQTVTGTVYVYEDDDLIASANVINGLATITLRNLPLGSHDLFFQLESDDYDFEESALIVVEPKKYTIKPTAYIGTDNFLSVTLPANAKGTLYVDVKNLKTGKITTIESDYRNGKAVMPASKLAEGSYAITDFYMDDAKYGEFYYSELPSFTEDVPIAKISIAYPKLTLKTVKVKKSSTKPLTITASLGKVDGKYLKGKTLAFKFNGKTYKAKTNAKGVAKVTIKTSVLKKLKVGKKITYQVTYVKKTVKKTLKVLN